MKSVMLLSDAKTLADKVECHRCNWAGTVDDCSMRFCILICPKCLMPVSKTPFLPGSFDKRFARSMGTLARMAEPKPLTEKQRDCLYKMAERYKRQMNIGKHPILLRKEPTP